MPKRNGRSRTQTSVFCGTNLVGFHDLLASSSFSHQCLLMRFCHFSCFSFHVTYAFFEGDDVSKGSNLFFYFHFFIHFRGYLRNLTGKKSLPLSFHSLAKQKNEKIE